MKSPITRGPSHRGLHAFMAERHIAPSEERADGAAVLVCDERIRVFVHPAAQGSLVLEARVMELAVDTRRADAALRNALVLASERLADAPEALVLTPDGRELQLQWPVNADDDARAVAAALEEFLNALGDWRRAMGEL